MTNHKAEVKPDIQDPERLMESAAEVAAIALSNADPANRKELLEKLANGIENSGVVTVDITEGNPVADKEGEDGKESGYPTYQTLTREKRLRRAELIGDDVKGRYLGRLTARTHVEITLRGSMLSRKVKSTTID